MLIEHLLYARQCARDLGLQLMKQESHFLLRAIRVGGG